jgi:hypothetical protein
LIKIARFTAGKKQPPEDNPSGGLLFRWQGR